VFFSGDKHGFFRLNPLSLVEVCTPIVSRLSNDPSENVIDFLDKLSDKVKGSNEAFVMAKILIGRIYLLRSDVLKTKVSQRTFY